jgi:hypothetical protein
MDAGTYSAVICGIIDLGTQTVEWDGVQKQQPQLLLQIEFPSETYESKGATRTRILSTTVTKSVHEKSTLRKHLTSLFGRNLTSAELDDFELSDLLGKPATVSVIQKPKLNGERCASISSIGAPMKGVDVKATRETYFDLADPSTYAAVQELPGWMQEKINQSAEAIASKLTFPLEEDNFSITTDSPPDDNPF